MPHQIRTIGISNVSLDVLRKLYDLADVKPFIVQNRFTPANDYDTSVRRFCRARGMNYQAFGVLKDKPEILNSVLINEVLASLGTELSREAALYLLVLGLGENMTIIDGTDREEEMRHDLAALRWFKEWIRGEENIRLWAGHMETFKEMIGESWKIRK